MNRTFATLAIAALIIPAAAQAQDVRATSATTASASTPEARVESALSAALHAGVPVELLANKVAEGRAKGIPMDRIATAVEHRAHVLTTVKAAIEAGRQNAAPAAPDAAAGQAADASSSAGATIVSAVELVAAADAHERGVSVETLTDVTARAGSQRAVAISVLADLVAAGHAPDHALARVRAALSGEAGALARLRAATAAVARIEIGNTTRPAPAPEAETRTRARTTVRVGG